MARISREDLLKRARKAADKHLAVEPEPEPKEAALGEVQVTESAKPPPIPVEPSTPVQTEQIIETSATITAEPRVQAPVEPYTHQTTSVTEPEAIVDQTTTPPASGDADVQQTDEWMPGMELNAPFESGDDLFEGFDSPAEQTEAVEPEPEPEVEQTNDSQPAATAQDDWSFPNLDFDGDPFESAPSVDQTSVEPEPEVEAPVVVEQEGKITLVVKINEQTATLNEQAMREIVEARKESEQRAKELFLEKIERTDIKPEDIYDVVITNIKTVVERSEQGLYKGTYCLVLSRSESDPYFSNLIKVLPKEELENAREKLRSENPQDHLQAIEILSYNQEVIDPEQMGETEYADLRYTTEGAPLLETATKRSITTYDIELEKSILNPKILEYIQTSEEHRKAFIELYSRIHSTEQTAEAVLERINWGHKVTIQNNDWITLVDAVLGQDKQQLDLTTVDEFYVLGMEGQTTDEKQAKLAELRGETPEVAEQTLTGIPVAQPAPKPELEVEYNEYDQAPWIGEGEASRLIVGSVRGKNKPFKRGVKRFDHDPEPRELLELIGDDGVETVKIWLPAKPVKGETQEEVAGGYRKYTLFGTLDLTDELGYTLQNAFVPIDTNNPDTEAQLEATHSAKEELRGIVLAKGFDEQETELIMQALEQDIQLHTQMQQEAATQNPTLVIKEKETGEEVARVTPQGAVPQESGEDLDFSALLREEVGQPEPLTQAPAIERDEAEIERTITSVIGNLERTTYPNLYSENNYLGTLQFSIVHPNPRTGAAELIEEIVKRNATKPEDILLEISKIAVHIAASKNSKEAQEQRPLIVEQTEELLQKHTAENGAVDYENAILHAQTIEMVGRLDGMVEDGLGQTMRDIIVSTVIENAQENDLEGLRIAPRLAFLTLTKLQGTTTVDEFIGALNESIDDIKTADLEDLIAYNTINAIDSPVSIGVKKLHGGVQQFTILMNDSGLQVARITLDKQEMASLTELINQNEIAEAITELRNNPQVENLERETAIRLFKAVEHQIKYGKRKKERRGIGIHLSLIAAAIAAGAAYLIMDPLKPQPVQPETEKGKAKTVQVVPEQPAPKPIPVIPAQDERTKIKERAKELSQKADELERNGKDVLIVRQYIESARRHNSHKGSYSIKTADARLDRAQEELEKLENPASLVPKPEVVETPEPDIVQTKPDVSKPTKDVEPEIKTSRLPKKQPEVEKPKITLEKVRAMQTQMEAMEQRKNTLAKKGIDISEISFAIDLAQRLYDVRKYDEVQKVIQETEEKLKDLEKQEPKKKPKIRKKKRRKPKRTKKPKTKKPKRPRLDKDFEIPWSFNSDLRQRTKQVAKTMGSKIRARTSRMIRSPKIKNA